MTKPADDNYEFQKIIAVVGLGLMLIKFFAYYLTGSVAILTDAMESIVNVIAAFVGLFALYISAQPADKTHPFGHGKVELISATIEGTMIMVAGALIILKSLKSFWEPGQIGSLDIGLLLILATAVVNYTVGRIAIRKGKKNRSPALVASGKHLCSDTYSTIGITIGLVVVMVAMYFGYDARWIDSSIAMIFGTIIIITGVKVIKSCMDDVMDRADIGIIRSVTRAINQSRHDDWIDVYRLRMIKYGSNVYIDVHIVFPYWMNLEDVYRENYELLEAVEKVYGEELQISITPNPCREFNCLYCERDCPNRKAAFVAKVHWGSDNICAVQGHALDIVSIHED